MNSYKCDVALLLLGIKKSSCDYCLCWTICPLRQALKDNFISNTSTGKGPPFIVCCKVFCIYFLLFCFFITLCLFANTLLLQIILSFLKVNICLSFWFFIHSNVTIILMRPWPSLHFSNGPPSYAFLFRCHCRNYLLLWSPSSNDRLSYYMLYKTRNAVILRAYSDGSSSDHQ